MMIQIEGGKVSEVAEEAIFLLELVVKDGVNIVSTTYHINRHGPFQTGKNLHLHNHKDEIKDGAIKMSFPATINYRVIRIMDIF